MLDHLSVFMRPVTLVHPHQMFHIPREQLVEKCDLFIKHPTLTTFPYTLKSQVSLADCREFVSALAGTRVTIKNDNFRGLSQLCEEFRFGDLAVRLSKFRESGNFKEQVIKEGVKYRISISMTEIDPCGPLFEGTSNIYGEWCYI
jgi:hypothetical protein